MHSRAFLIALSAVMLGAAGFSAGCRQVTAKNKDDVATNPPRSVIAPRREARASGVPVRRDVPDLGTAIVLPESQDVSEPFRSAAQTLFRQGLADPAGGEYREVTVHVGNVWGQRDADVKTHGWVLPGQLGEAVKKAVCPNGLIYTVRSVGGKASVKADIAAFLNGGARAGRLNRGIYQGGRGTATPEAESVSYESPGLIYACLLFRSGEQSAAESLYRKLTGYSLGTDSSGARNDFDPYPQLANEWAWTTYDRAVCAHMRGEDALTLADATILTKAQPLIAEEIKARRDSNANPNNKRFALPSPLFPFLKNLPELLADAERRVARGEVIGTGTDGAKSKKGAAKIAALIADLENVAERQSGQPGGVGLDASPICEALIAEGEAAVEPLLDSVENDKRLTRSVSFGRDFFQDRNLLTVRSAAFACFVRITGVSQFGDGKNIGAVKAWWAKNKGRSVSERWYVQLADDGKPRFTGANDYQQESARNHENNRRWGEAADAILQRSDVVRRGRWTSMPPREPGASPPPFRGEPLRGKTDPSVSELLAKRALEMSEPRGGRWGFDFQHGATFALQLYTWDARSPLTLPTLREVMARCLEFERNQDRGEGRSLQYQMGGRISALTLARIALGDDKAASEYVAWLGTVSPEYLGHDVDSALHALADGVQFPALRRGADRVFGDPSSKWSRLYADPKSRGNYGALELLNGRMLRVTPFRELVLKSLQDRAPAGTVAMNGGSSHSVHYKWVDGGSMSAGNPMGVNPPGRKPTQTVRVCDRVAMSLQGLPGVPAWDPFAVVSERNRQCAAVASYLQRYAANLRVAEQYESPLYSFAGSSRFTPVEIGFEPSKSAPATACDVAEDRAIFHLDGGNRPRVVADLPVSLPFEASWGKDQFARVSKTRSGAIHRWSPGKVYQAEEEWDGKRWRRYYGFVGAHTIAKVPAEEIEITDHRYRARTNAGTSSSKREP